MKKTILIIDDNVDLLEIMALRLKTSGYEVLKASDGQEAIDTLDKQKPDLILLDLSMPLIYGVEIATFVKRDPKLKDIPIMVVTGNIKDVEAQAKRCQARDYLLKPFEPEDLLKKVQNIIG